MSQEIIQFDNQQKNLIIKTIMPEGSTSDELELFIAVCRRTKLDPFSRQIYATKILGKLSVQATIDGFRVIAERSGEYEGQTVPLYLDKQGLWHEVWIQQGFPVAAKVGVYKKGFKEPLYGVAKWSSYVPITHKGMGYMWSKMPEVMIAKVAEALALRKAFPNDLSGVYSAEEMEQAKVVVVEDSTNTVTAKLPDIKQYNLIKNSLEVINTVEKLEMAIEKIANFENLTDDQKEELILAYREKATSLAQKE